ncbi:hypothetical protein [Burkholderia multivorans]|uniref:hypothetical protein n=1 Tax=Burkholderia multivorans TaxID=87883 RepID=UPI001589C16A|nr:hypothetical protein [Burkholderia multivorans]MBU9309858.1 hypothetical protein [Burkholderia multivorans]MBU9574275.1 hypothetical protein [Burkholderia multivorans]MDN7950261.1 hypothetical protein [Burkholderia multivorans]MDN7964812.1 hypothetical protein [Burkholderia multivorans]MDR9241563.1 hypothetical protein [Burkholderia multivorans]
MALPDIGAWEVQLLRASFISQQPVGKAEDWWQTAVGVAPEQVTSKPNVLEHSETGAFGPGRLDMRIAFNRADWIYSAVDAGSPKVPVLGGAADFLSALRNPVKTWLEAKGREVPWVRVAFGAVLLMPVETIKDGNAAIGDYLPIFNAKESDVKDLFLQVNYPRDSKNLEDNVINRLIKLSTLSLQLINITPAGPVPSVSDFIYCRAELDFSTPVEHTSRIPVDKIVGIFDELSDSAEAMMKEGVGP